MSASPQRERRSYRSPRRQEQAAETRELVLSAAGTLFGTQGWSATGMRDVARQAGVAVETVYSNFSSKSELLMAAIDVGVVGDVEPVPLAQRPEFAALSAGSFADRVGAAARLVADVNQRTAGLHRALGEAAGSDPALAEKLVQGEKRRQGDVKQAAELITGRRIDPTERDGVWAVTSVEVFHLLTAIGGWSTRRYQEWLAELLGQLLAEQTGQGGPGEPGPEERSS